MSSIGAEVEIATTKGFKLASHLKENEKVFDGDGRVCKIISTRCFDCELYKVIFDDGNFIYVGNDQEFLVHDWAYRKALRRKKNPRLTPQRLSIDKIKINLKYMNGDSMYAVPITNPVEYGERELVLDPYFIGFWLSQDHVKDNFVVIKNIDVEILEKIRNSGLKARFYKESAGMLQASYEILHNDFDVWEELSKLDPNRIPKEYLESDIISRIKLLQGFMDGMGEVKFGNAKMSFGQKRKALKFDFIQLASSLGIKVNNNPKVNSVNISNLDFDLFSVSRKSKSLRESARFTQKYRYIVGVEPIGEFPAVQIEVDNMLLCTRSYIKMF